MGGKDIQMNGMTLRFHCPSFAIYEYEIDQEGTPDSIRLVLMVMNSGGWTFRRFDRGMIKKYDEGKDIDEFKLQNYL